MLPRLTNKSLLTGNESISILCCRERYKQTLLYYISNSPQTFKPNEFIECTFNGRELQTKFHGIKVNSQEAKLGDTFYIHAQGQKKPPIISFPEMPTPRGTKIAWILSFIGAEKYMTSEKDFYDAYQKLIQTNSITNTAVFTKYGRFAVVIADRHIPEKGKVKKNNPVLAWIADDLTREELNSLLDKYELRKKLPCPREFFYHL